MKRLVRINDITLLKLLKLPLEEQPLAITPAGPPHRMDGSNRGKVRHFRNVLRYIPG